METKVKFSSIIKNVSFPAMSVFSFVSWFLFVSSDPAQFLSAQISLLNSRTISHRLIEPLHLQIPKMPQSLK